MIEKPFEVPYNFDLDLISFYGVYKEYINFLFIPPYKDHATNTRTILQSNSKGSCYMPNSIEEYELHLLKIKEAGLRFVVLWQKHDEILSDELLDYYIGKGACGFIVCSDENAQKIKQKDKKLIVVCSIVQRICSDMTKRDFSNYDYIVLYYPFNRSLSVLDKLSHLKNKLIVMPNTVCSTECPAMHHWFPNKDKPFNADKDCFTYKRLDRCCFIYPEHLKLFDKYVAGYKLQGREYPTHIIKSVCEDFFLRNYKSGTIDPDIINVINLYLSKMDCIDYYDVKTKDLIDIV